MRTFNAKRALQSVHGMWEDEIVPALSEYIRIPNLSPEFDEGWQAAGHMERAVAIIAGWCRKQDLPGLTVEVIRLEGRTPLICMEITARGSPAPSGTVLLYGHLDKQPECGPWREGLSPWEPVREGDRLYGRGGADDGYATFASIAALRLLAEQDVPHARCIILIEAGEESGSPDLPAYIEELAPGIGEPDLVICLDSGCGDYERLWMTTSLRGVVMADLRVDILTEGVHSGDASGIVPSSFRIMRQLLSRIEDDESGEVVVPALEVSLPNERFEQARVTAKVLGPEILNKFPWVEGANPYLDTDEQQPLRNFEALLRRTWEPALCVTGADGLPPLEKAGNVMRPSTTLRLSMRIPPTLDPDHAMQEMKRVLEHDPPNGARVTFEPKAAAAGWNAPPLAPWLGESIDQASLTFFGKPFVAMGEGGTIPFMRMLGEKFPQAQFLITGVLGPHSNAHGPNEFLHLPTAERLTGCVAQVIADHTAKR